ncbi:MAG: bifunctional oligoribonuclease/PAP phosphatase NrnA [Phycisphaerae bacterium]|jgi:phosphoesterase RecJ-like protein
MAITDDFQRALELISRSQNILITTHTRPDGDACGSLLAMAEAFRAQGKNVTAMLLSELPQWYEFLFEHKLPIYDNEIKPDQLTGIDLIVLVDVNSDSQLPKFCDYLKNQRNGAKLLVIDHHVTNDGLGNVEIIDISAAATGLIVYDLFQFAGWTITEKIANALFVAISTDTGWFQFSSTDARTFTTCGKLMEFGVNAAELYRKLYQNFTPQRFRLMTRMFDSLELHLDGRYAVQQLTLKDFEETGASYTDTENLIDRCRCISSVQAVAFFTEQKDGRVRCSLRSTGKVDMRLVGQKFGGGGHIVAAGVHLPGPMENAKKLIYDTVKEQLIA